MVQNARKFAQLQFLLTSLKRQSVVFFLTKEVISELSGSKMNRSVENRQIANETLSERKVIDIKFSKNDNTVEL